MKKAMTILAAALSILLLAGCDMLANTGDAGGGGSTPETPAEKTPLELVIEKYGRLADATEIEQTIGITQGDVLQYESEKSISKAGSGYHVTGTEKRLNALSSGAAEAYSETPVEYTVKSGNFSVKLELDELYFSTKPTYTDGSMEVGIWDSSVETVFGLEELSSPVHDMKLKIQTDSVHVTQMEIGYQSNRSQVKIVLKYKY